VRERVVRDPQVVVTPVGRLHVESASRLHVVLVKELADGRPVLVDLSAIGSWRPPALTVFAAAAESAGGWPMATLVMFGASGALGEALMAKRVTDTVPLAADVDAARERARHRPDTVRAHRVFPPGTAGLAEVRSFVREACGLWGLPGREREPAVVVANELVGNAIVHAGTECRLSLEHDRRWLRVRVRDGSPVLPVRAATGTKAVGVHGLGLVDALAVDWGTMTHPDGKTVWACLPASSETSMLGPLPLIRESTRDQPPAPRAEPSPDDGRPDSSGPERHRA
jgi:hypothetical protein